MNLEEKITHQEQQIGVLQKMLESLQKTVESLQKMVVPPGAVQAFAMPNAPSGWLECDGRILNRKDYPRLFDTIGETFGEGDGITTFQLPDLEGLFIRGWDNWGNIDPERSFGSIQEDALQGHRHTSYGHTHKGYTSKQGGHAHAFEGMKIILKTVTIDGIFSNYRINEPFRDNNTTDLKGEHTHSFKTEKSKEVIGEPLASDAGMVRVDIETRPKNIALLYCIKY